VLIVEHSSDDDAGRLIPALDRAGFHIQTVRTDAGQLPPRSLDGYSGFVAMGGDMFVSEADRYPFIEIEQRLFREAIEANTPALGICLGAQILASALGSRVSRDWGTQIGWDVVRFNADGDQLVAPLAPESMLFEWHHESVELPVSAILLGASDAIPVQAFRAGSAWGFQFHLEVEARHVRSWSESNEGRRELAEFGVPSPLAEEGFAERLERQISIADRVFGEFARLAAS
jgi:GMP synthase (glutamine-hydrolysing)